MIGGCDSVAWTEQVEVVVSDDVSTLRWVATIVNGTLVVDFLTDVGDVATFDEMVVAMEEDGHARRIEDGTAADAVAYAVHPNGRTVGTFNAVVVGDAAVFNKVVRGGESGTVTAAQTHSAGSYLIDVAVSDSVEVTGFAVEHGVFVYAAHHVAHHASLDLTAGFHGVRAQGGIQGRVGAFAHADGYVTQVAKGALLYQYVVCIVHIDADASAVFNGEAA